MGFRSWYRSQDVAVKAAVISGIALLTAAVVTPIVTFELSRDSGATQQPSNNQTSRSIASNTPASSKPMQATGSLQFFNLREDQKVGASISPLEIAGTVSSGEHAWVLVKSSDEYYVQGSLSQSHSSPNFWTLGTVSFGSATGPIGAPYEVYVILADSQESSIIQKDYEETDNGNNGIPRLPSGVGIRDGCQVTVFRSH